MNRHPLALFVLWMSAAVVAGVILVVGGWAGVRADADRFDQEENALWALINDYRQEHGVQPVGLNDSLMAAAAWMAEDMAANDRYSHTDSLGRSARERMADFGYIIRQTATGEVLAAGVDTAQEAFDLLKASPKHNEAMLNPRYWAIGIARAYDGDSAHGWYWTVDFGGRGPAWFPAMPTPSPAPTPTPSPVPAPVPVLPTGPYESPHSSETPPLEPAELPSMGTNPR